MNGIYSLSTHIFDRFSRAIIYVPHSHNYFRTKNNFPIIKLGQLSKDWIDPPLRCRIEVAKQKQDSNNLKRYGMFYGMVFPIYMFTSPSTLGHKHPRTLLLILYQIVLVLNDMPTRTNQAKSMFESGGAKVVLCSIEEITPVFVKECTQAFFSPSQRGAKMEMYVRYFVAPFILTPCYQITCRFRKRVADLNIPLLTLTDIDDILFSGKAVVSQIPLPKYLSPIALSSPKYFFITCPYYFHFYSINGPFS